MDVLGEFNALRSIYLPAPEITRFEIIAGTPRISFTTMAGGTYRGEWSNSLSGGSWTTVTGADNIPGSGGVAEISDPDVAPGNLLRRFYRVLLLH